MVAEFGITSFDLEAEEAKLERQFPGMWNTPQMQDNKQNKALETFGEQQDLALQNKCNFSYQTNLHNRNTNDTRIKFADEGFTTHLFFLFVTHVEVCKQRVIKRISEGGHYVPENEIENRFAAGLKNLDAFFIFFDYLKIIDTTPEKNTMLLEINNKILTHIDPFMLDVCKSHRLKQLSDFINDYSFIKSGLDV